MLRVNIAIKSVCDGLCADGASWNTRSAHFPTHVRICVVQVAAVVVYVICGLFSSSFVTNYVVVVVLLMLDFWTVSFAHIDNMKRIRRYQCLGDAIALQANREPCACRRKMWLGDYWWGCGGGTRSQMRAATGGLRPWKRLAIPLQANAQPHVQLCYERPCPLCMPQGQRAINGKDAACFWWTLYIFVRPVLCPHLHY